MITINKTELEAAVSRMVDRVLIRKGVIQEDLLTIQETMEVLGVSRMAILKYVRTGRLIPEPRESSRRKLYFKRTAVEEFKSIAPKYLKP